MSYTSQWLKFSFLTFAVILFLSGLAAGQCAANANGFSDTAIESGDQAPTDTVLNAYATIFIDADPRAGSFCNSVAATHLRNKLANTQNAGSHLDMLQRNVGPFAGWLEGAYVTYIFPAAIRLNQDGLLSSDTTLQNLLLWVATTYNNVASRPNGAVVGLGSLDNCGLDSTHGFANTCMDDYSVAAAGFAWAAAYARMVNNPTLYGQLVDAAHFMIARSYDTTQSICIVPNSVATSTDPQPMAGTNGRGPCTGTAQDLIPPQTGISVVAGTYGGNCGASHGNVTAALASACNTLSRCDYIVDYTIIGDPAPGCAKDYVAEWTCNGQSLVQQATASPEAGYRKTVTLDCLPAQTFSLNHIGETPAYGFGLLTSISSATLGLRLAAADYGFSSAEQYISKALAAEATRLTEPTGNGFPFDYHFKNRPTLNDPPGCPVIVPVGDSSFATAPQFQITYPVNVIIGSDGKPHAAGGDCADAGYFPRMYPLSDFYSTFIGSPGTLLPLGFGAALFNQDPQNGHFASGRQVYYGSLGWDARGSIMVPTAPLSPTPVYPADGGLHAPANFNLRWNSGVDASRRFPWWPVTYAIYYKAWVYGGVEPANYTLFSSGMPCNADSGGICNMAVSGVSDGNYRYYVIASMDENVPANSGVFSTQSPTAYFTVGYQPISTIPPPLPPTPVYPNDGLQGAPSDFPVRWNDGLDPSRRNGQYPTTYALYYKYWPFGGVEPANYTLVVAAQPCNAQVTGICETFVSGEPNGNFRWYMIANMDVSLFTGVPNSILSTQSSVATFTVGQPATGISVVAGTYGGNCGAPHGNVTAALGSACNTLGRCDYIVDYTIIGDPAPGCAKDYVAEWTCNGQSLVQQATASPEAGFRKTVTLTCP
jgi:hypothetical protein